MGPGIISKAIMKEAKFRTKILLRYPQITFFVCLWVLFEFLKKRREEKKSLFLNGKKRILSLTLRPGP